MPHRSLHSYPCMPSGHGERSNLKMGTSSSVHIDSALDSAAAIAAVLMEAA